MYKYKPIEFTDFEISETTINILETLISIDNLNILFVGDSGCGKTSMIYSLIHRYYGDVKHNNDVLEINSLKDQGIQYYRNEIKTFCQKKCSIQKKKDCYLR